MNDTHDVTIEFPVHFTRGTAGRKQVNVGVEPAAPSVETGHIPRVARLMALAIRFDDLVRSGEVEDFADIADLGQVTRARISQIVNLLNLAPDIQEAMLFLPAIEGEREAVSEHEVRAIAMESDWGRQREAWRVLASATAGGRTR